MPLWRECGRLVPDDQGVSKPKHVLARLGRHPLALRERLDAIAEDIRGQDPEGMGIVDRFVARLELARSGAEAPDIGESFPPFMLPDHEGHLASLGDFLGEKPLIVVFHRGHWCPYCRTTIAALSEAQPRLAAARIVAISAETQRFTRRIRAETGARFRFLSDMDATFTASVGLAIALDPAMRMLLEAAGKRVPDFQGSSDWILPIPAVFVLDAGGIVRARHVDPDYRRRMEIDDLVAAVRQLSGSEA